MATDLTGNPWVLDAADIGALPRTILGTQQQSTLSDGLGPKSTYTQQMALGVITWNVLADGVAGDQVVMTDLSGHEVYRSAPCTGAEFSDQIKYVDTIKARGLIVTSLPHGVVHIQFR